MAQFDKKESLAARKLGGQKVHRAQTDQRLQADEQSEAQTEKRLEIIESYVNINWAQSEGKLGIRKARQIKRYSKVCMYGEQKEIPRQNKLQGKSKAR